MGFVKGCGVLALFVSAGLGALFFYAPPDILNGVSSKTMLSAAQLQLAVGGFCLSPIPNQLLNDKGRGKDEHGYDFKQEGDIQDEDYDKGSIYSVLYALYSYGGQVKSEKGVPYQFTFNTWGISPTRYPDTEPQRHGKEAYAGLVSFPEVKEYLKEVTDKPTIVEIGCGTGAGANEITRNILKKAKYLAIDMQFAAIQTCKKIHGNAENPGMKCVHAPGGVGNDGNKVFDETGKDVPDNSVDFVIISETHIADVQIGPEEKEIFAEIKRILKPGGFFLWGNALPTRVWHEGYEYLTSVGFERESSLNHTKGAVIARDEDEPRVNAYCKQVFDKFYAFKLPLGIGEKCEIVSDRLLKNFYRHPGTALYERMVTGVDSYMHEAYRLGPKKAAKRV
jgi:SAM-dependent methyltransferase